MHEKRSRAGVGLALTVLVAMELNKAIRRLTGQRSPTNQKD